MPNKITALLLVCLCFLPFQAGGGNDLAKQDKTRLVVAQKATGADELAKLGKARLDAAEKAYKGWFGVQRIAEGLGQGDTVLYDLSVRWLHAELDLITRKEERIAAYTAHLQRMKDWAKIWAGGGLAREGRAPLLAIIDATEKEAEYWLARERARK
jgi:hypothetical protein